MRRALVIALLVVLAGAGASADSNSESERLAREGIALAKSGDLEHAVERLKAAQKLSPRPNNDCNLGLAHARLQRWARAYLYLDRCRNQVKVGLPDWVDKRLKQSLEGLKAALYVPVEVVSDPPGARVSASSFDDDEWEPAPTTLWLPLGEREVSIELEGYLPVRRALKLDDVRPQSLKVTLEKNAALQQPPPVPVAVLVEPPSSPAPAPSLAPPQERAPHPSSRLKVAGGATLGVGLAALGSSLALYLVARDVATPDANREVRGSPAFHDALDRFHGEYYSAIALFAVGGALTLGGVAVLSYAAKKRR